MLTKPGTPPEARCQALHSKQGPVLLSVVSCKEQLMWGVLIIVIDDLTILDELSCCC